MLTPQWYTYNWKNKHENGIITYDTIYMCQQQLYPLNAKTYATYAF